VNKITAHTLFLVCLLFAPLLDAAEASIAIVDDAGHSVPGAGVALVGSGTPTTERSAPEAVVMDQLNEQFVPDFLVVSTGTEVSFPNSDRVLHHVYSFSPAKTFELPLYRGMLPSPVRFEREGIVVIGCNIHDHMIGHVWVVDTSLHALTDANGRARFVGLPAGTYRVLAWHPRAGRNGVKEEQLVVPVDGETSTSVSLPLAKQVATRGSLSWRATY
jgi:plastocyanin